MLPTILRAHILTPTLTLIKMKLRSILCGMLAMAAIAACEQPQPEVTPALDLNKTAAAVAADGGAVEFEVTANVDWTADADQDWVSVDPQTGNGNAKVKATVAANETADARTAKVTVKADKLTKTLTITQEGKKSEDPGEDPGEDPKPTVAWGMMGCFVDNLWSSDVPMTQEGEWIVAKGAQFTELTFKIRGNGSWDDATNIGVAPGAERGVVNGKVSVVTAEYSKANLGGDAADIKLNGEPGTYDVYFSFENLEVYVMEEGYKPGEKEPQNPDPVEITYTVVGTLNNINWNNAAPEGLMTAEGDYYVARNVPFVTAATLYGGADQIEFKIVETGTWTGYGRVEEAVNPVNTEIALQMGGDNIMVTGAEGPYDVYFDKANLKVWVMTPGTTPGAAPETPVTPVTEGVIWENDGTVGPANWDSTYRFAIEGGDSLGECVAEIPAAVWAGMKIAPFSVNITPDPSATWWQVRVLDGWWTNNDESGASDITINTPGLVDNGNGTYTFVVDLTANPELAALIDTQHLLFTGAGYTINKIYFGEPENPGQGGGEEPAKSDWHIVGSFTGEGWGWDAAAGIALDILDANYFGLLGFELPEGAQFKFLQGTAWGGAEVGAVASVVEPNTIQAKGTNNIMGIPAGKYDIYLAADASTFYIMSEGKTPAEATEPAPVEVTYTVTGTIKDANWNNAAPVGLMVEEGGVYVAKNVEFQWESTCYGGADQIALKIFETGTWNGYGVNDTAVHEANTEIPVVYGGANNVNIAAPEGVYDVYFDKTNEKVWVVAVGQPETPAQVVYADDFEWLAEIAAAAGAGDSVGEDNASAKAPNVWKMDNSADFFAAFNERGYQYLYSTVGMTEYAAGPAQEPNPEVGKEGSLYVQTNYLKFGQSSYNGAIVLPALAAIEGTADVVIEFDWCWQVTGKNKPDIMTMSVDATAGTFEATAAATSANIESAQSLVDGESHLAWQHATVVLNGATAETVLTIRPTNADPSVQNPERSQNRWFLDNIKVSTK